MLHCMARARDRSRPAIFASSEFHFRILTYLRGTHALPCHVLSQIDMNLLATIILLAHTGQNPQSSSPLSDLHASKDHGSRKNANVCTTLTPKISPSTDSISCNRRQLLFGINSLIFGCIARPHISESADPVSSKPFAPLENLLPATRVKLLIDTSANVAEQLCNLKNSGGATSDTKQQLIAMLEKNLLQTDQFMTVEEVAVSKTYLEIKTLDNWTKKRQKETAEMFEIDTEEKLPSTA